MRLRTKNILFALLAVAGLTLSSCINDRTSGRDGNGTELTGETGYLSFRVSTHPRAVNSTRATEVGDTEEGIVKSGMVLLYDYDTKKLLYNFPLTIDNSGTAFTGSSVSTNVTPSKSQFVMKAQEVVLQDYWMLVVLNPTDEMVTVTDPATPNYFADFEKAQYAASAAVFAKSTGTNGQLYQEIAMTNARNLVHVAYKENDRGNDPFEETEKEAEQTVNIPKVGVDRVVAKVEFARAATVVTPTGGAFGDAEWMLDITNNYTYWVRRQALTAPLGTTGGLHEVDDASAIREDLYAIDPNWDGFSNDRIAEENPTLPAPWPNLRTQFTYNNQIMFANGSRELKTTGANREYVLENTMAADEQWEDVTTRILMRGNYIPSTTIGANNSYYFYAGAAFTHADILKYYDTNVWPDAPTGLKEACDASGFNFAPGSTEPNTSLTDPNNRIHFYKFGMSYYSILIRHFDDGLSDENMGYGRYGVVRNNVYKVTLNKVSGPGSPNIPDPKGPDDKDKEYLSADILVLPWVIREQGVEL